MFKINPKNNDMVITKGDSAFIQVDVKTLEGGLYEIQPDDVITMTVRKRANADKTFEEMAVGNIITIVPEDTKSAAPGSYIYDVQLVTGQGIVQTIVPVSNFYIEEEVTQ